MRHYRWDWHFLRKLEESGWWGVCNCSIRRSRRWRHDGREKSGLITHVWGKVDGIGSNEKLWTGLTFCSNLRVEKLMRCDLISAPQMKVFSKNEWSVAGRSTADKRPSLSLSATRRWIVLLNLRPKMVQCVVLIYCFPYKFVHIGLQNCPLRPIPCFVPLFKLLP